MSGLVKVRAVEHGRRTRAYWRRRRGGARGALEQVIDGAGDLRQRLYGIPATSPEAAALRGAAVTWAARGLEAEIGGRDLLLVLERFAREEPDAGPRLIDELLIALEDERAQRYAGGRR
jgi:hypothetical protein